MPTQLYNDEERNVLQRKLDSISPKKEENESLDSLKMKDNNRPSNNVYNLSSRTESRIKDDLNIFTTEMEWAG